MDNNYSVPIVIAQRVREMVSYKNGLPEQLSDREMFTLCYIEEGFTCLNIDNDSYYCSAPSFLCLNSRQLLHNESASCFKCHSLIFSPRFISATWTSPWDIPSCDAVSSMHEHLLLRPFLHNQFKQSYVSGLSPDAASRASYDFNICKEQLAHCPDWYWPYRTRSSLLDCLHLLETIYYQQNAVPSPIGIGCALPHNMEDLKKAVGIVASMYTHPDLTATSLIEQLHTNKKTLNAQFHAAFNRSIYQYILDYRLSMAMQKLRYTQLSIEAIALSCGFNCSTSFSIIFKRKHGIPPSRFREIVSEKRPYTDTTTHDDTGNNSVTY